VRFSALSLLLVGLVGCTEPIFLDGDGGMDAAIDGAPGDGATDGGVSDALVDGGQPLAFGIAHVPIALHLGATEPSVQSSHFAPELSDDGRTLFFTRVSDNEASGELVVAQRTYDPMTNAYGEFDPSTRVDFEPPPDRPILRATVTGNTLQVFVEVDLDDTADRVPRIMYATRSSATGAFGPLAEVPAFSGMAARRPTVSRDGLHLIVESDAGLLHARRDSTDVLFEATMVEMIDVPAPAEEPRLSPDGLVLTFRGTSTQLEVSRSSTEVAFFGPPVTSRYDAQLSDEGFLPFHSRKTNELWYSLYWPGYEEVPSLGAMLMRVRTCAGTCTDDRALSCGTGEVESEDGLHCFSVVTPETLEEPAWHQQVAVACASEDKQAASVHLPLESAIIAELLNTAGVGPAYIGLRRDGSFWRWATFERHHERYFGGNWGSNPTGAAAALFDPTSSTWTPVDGMTQYAGVCERTLWPAWPAPGP
jgi:hypothetical protein